MFSKQQIFDFIALFTLACIGFICGISADAVGLWEPWETSTILAAQHMVQSNLTESAFWVPRLEGTFVAQPYLELWSIGALLRAFGEQNAMILRLPGACAGIFLVMMTFLTTRQIASRRSAWVAALIALTLPMLTLSGRFIHGDIWLILAVALPNMLYLMACYATTRRMNRVLISLTALSIIISFLSGGIFALVILLVQGCLSTLFLLKNSQLKDVVKPLKTQFFLVPLYIAFVVCGCIFGIYVNHARSELENRSYVTLAELNNALDEDRVIRIERRQNQIIGELRESGRRTGQTPFILVESAENLNTNAQEIFNLHETEVRTFENYLMWRFQKKMPAKTDQTVPEIGEAFKYGLNFFWYHTNTPYKESTMALARVRNASSDVVVYPEIPVNPDAPALNEASAGLGNVVTLAPNELVRLLGSDAGIDADSKWAEIETGAGEHGYVQQNVLADEKDGHAIKWTSWLDVLLFGLMPWGCFIPIVFVCLLSNPKKLSIARYPFRGEFVFQTVDDVGDQKTPVQMILLSWIIVSVIALFVGINHSRHDMFVGVIPVAIAMAIALTSARFWRSLRDSLEARIGLILFAFVTLCIAVFEFRSEPFRFVRYLMTDPFMHWDNEYKDIWDAWLGQVVIFCTAFFVLTLISFTGAVEAIQEKINEWREIHKHPAMDARTSSSTALLKISRGNEEPIAYAPTVSLVALGLMSACFLHFFYAPSVSDNFTETALIRRYFELANQSEPVYLLSGENAQLCGTYRDCEPGYVCQNSRCRISTFASYSLNVARSVSKNDMLENLTHDIPVFYIVPKDALYGINQSYREVYSAENRQNLRVLSAPSSRLYLIGNHEEIESVSPFEQIFPAALPEDASLSNIDLNDSIRLEGFKLNRLDFARDKVLEMTVFYRVKKTVLNDLDFRFSFDLSNRKIDISQSILQEPFDAHRLLIGDLVARKMQFELTSMPSQGVIDVFISLAEDGKTTDSHRLTSIEF